MKQMSGLAEFVFLRTYAQFMGDKGRYETWAEACDRYCTSMLVKAKPRISEGAFQALLEAMPEVRELMHERSVVPAMRAINMAGSGRLWEREDASGYNCSFLEIDGASAFSEALFLLMCGVGVGYSVEYRVVDKLPVVPPMEDINEVIKVEDSREGWADGLRKLLDCLWQGKRPQWDLSAIRPKGAALKVTGGKASGPEPVDWLFQQAVRLFTEASEAQERMRPDQLHELMCCLGAIVQVGGVRRSAMLSLFSLMDKRMRRLKSGDWHKTKPWLSQANNSVVFEGDFNADHWDGVWNQAFGGGFGEPGMFNRNAVQSMAPERRKRLGLFGFIKPGTNPCGEIHLLSREFCNLTEVVLRPYDTSERIYCKVRAATLLGTLQAMFTDFGWLSKQSGKWRENCEAEQLLGVSLAGICSSPLMQMEPRAMGRALGRMKLEAVLTNQKWARIFGRSASVAVTTVKPSGTASLVCDTSPGIHAFYAPHYIRRVRTEPGGALARAVIENGWPHDFEPTPNGQGHVLVAAFPQKAPEGSICAVDNAVGQMQRLLTLYDNWTEHGISVTLSYNGDEEPVLKDLVFRHFDELSSTSYETLGDWKYDLPVYEAITAAQYQDMMGRLPAIDWQQATPAPDEVDEVARPECGAGGCMLA